MNWQKVYNPILAALLRSPLHGLVSGSIVLLTFTGRRSGRAYSTPLNYTRVGDDLLITSLPGRTWWKNLRGGTPVTLRLVGHEVKAVATAVEDVEGVAAGLLAVCQRVPAYRRYLGVELSADGQPLNPDRLAQAARDHVIVRITGVSSR